jgi:SAM-dependent methyltransferase
VIVTIDPPPPFDAGQGRRPPHDFDDAYATGNPPWDIGRPQGEFQRLGETGGISGRVLDVGCGTGEHTLLASSLGHDALGVDMSSKAIELATAKSNERGIPSRFVILDALRLTDLGEQFDTALDCGFFHVLDDPGREQFVRSLSRAVSVGGRYHMLCFSEHQPGDWGPRRVTQAEIRASLSEGWEIESIEPAVIEMRIDPQGAKAWHAVARRA